MKRGTGLAWLLLLAVLATLAVRIYPAVMPSFQDPDHYYHLRMGEEVAATGNIPTYDALSDGGRQYTYYPMLHLLIGAYSILLGLPPLFAYVFVSLLAGALSTLAVYVAARRLCRPRESERFSQYALLFAAAIPAFFARQTAFIRPDGFAAAAAALMLAFLVMGSAWGIAALGAFLVLLHPYTAVLVAGLAVIAVAADLMIGKICKTRTVFFGKEGDAKKAILLGTAFAVSCAALGTYYLRLPLGQLVGSKTIFTASEMQPPTPETILLVFGPALVFAFIALLKVFGKPDLPRRWDWAWLAALAAAGSALFLAALRNSSYSAVPMALLAGAGMVEAERKGGKYGGVLLAIVGIALVVTTYAALRDQGGQYSDQELAAFGYLGRLPSSPVVALWDRGHVITYLAKKPVVVDGYFEFEPGLDNKTLDIQLLFLSGEPQAAARLARKYSAGLVYIDNKTRSVFQASGQNPFDRALSASPSNGAFDKLFDSPDAQIYAVRKS
jgi:hypothetical protein